MIGGLVYFVLGTGNLIQPLLHSFTMTNLVQCLHEHALEVFKRNPLYCSLAPSLAGGPALNVLHKIVDRNEYYFKGYFQIASMRKNLLGAGQTNSAQELCYKTQIRVSQNADFLKRESQLVPQYLSKFVCHFKHAALSQGLVFNERTVTKFLGNVSGMHSQKCQDIILLLGNVFLFEDGKSICFPQTNCTILHF